MGPLIDQNWLPQLTAELLNGTGQTIAKSSRPCILLFRSLPVRVARTFLLGVPLLLGISTETQKVRVDILKHKEASAPRTNAIRVTLIPRAGTFSPPQLYEAEILINSQLPWPKKLIYNWKWTFYVWISLYTYVMLLLFLICCKPLVLSGPVVSFRDPHMVEEEGASTSTEEPKEHWNVGTGDGERDVAELLRKLRESRRRRRALLVAAEAAGSSADSSVSQTRGEMTTTATSGPAEDEAGDSESVC